MKKTNLKPPKKSNFVLNEMRTVLIDLTQHRGESEGKRKRLEASTQKLK